MNRLRKKAFLLGLLALVLLGGGICAGKFSGQISTINAVSSNEDNSTLISVLNANQFGDSGLYITRVYNPSSDRNYYGTISAENLISDYKLNNFDPQYYAYVKHQDEWELAPAKDFYLASDYEQQISDKCSIMWTLEETAPAAIYAVRCMFYDADNFLQESWFQILYTDNWTFISAFDENHSNYITNFRGGSDRTLSLSIYYNDGATVTMPSDSGKELRNGAKYGRLNDDEIISTDRLVASMKTLSGKNYELSQYDYDSIGNVMTFRFQKTLENDVYILKIYSAADNGQIFAQVIIDNQGAAKGINNSRLWILVMAFGAVLILFGTTAFFLPLIMAKINSNRVYRENVRINRMKNPDAYVVKTGTVMQRLKEKFKKLGKKVKPATEDEETTEEKPQVEDEVRSRPSFTEMIREKRATRDFMQEYGVSSNKADEIKQQNEAQDNNKKSFAFLRDDDDDEIATFHEAKDEVVTIETGSYVEDGVTFSKLDSMKDEDDFPGNNSNN